MKDKNRFITIFVFGQMLALFAVLIWLWIRRYSQEGVVKTPHMEIDLVPQKRPAKQPVKPAVSEPTEGKAESTIEQQTRVQKPRAPKPAATRRQVAKKDDLKRIEGIGPKIAAALQATGINTYKQLARARIERLQGIITDAGIIADPTTWPEQAALAAAGDWLGLAELKSTLKGGRRIN